MRVMISQPMSSVDESEVYETRKRAEEYLKDQGYEVIDTTYRNTPNDVKHTSIDLLGQALQKMADVDAVYFAKGWTKSRGCLVEHYVASTYGLLCITEDHIRYSPVVFQPDYK